MFCSGCFSAVRSGNESVSGRLSKRTGPTAATPRRRLIPLTDWPKFHSYPPLGGLRHLVFHSKSNGFDAVIRRIGRRILIDEESFFAWVDGDGIRKRSD